MTRKKILAVDDSSIVRRIIKNAVDALNYDLLEASDGMDALDVLEKHYEEIRLILLDWNMPGMNGFDFLLAVKNNRFFKSIPVMMITTEGEKGNIIKAVQAGVNNYLLKPFKTEELLKKILDITGTAAVGREFGFIFKNRIHTITKQFKAGSELAYRIGCPMAELFHTVCRAD